MPSLFSVGGRAGVVVAGWPPLQNQLIHQIPARLFEGYLIGARKFLTARSVSA
jgi:hypothetical protein